MKAINKLRTNIPIIFYKTKEHINKQQEPGENFIMFIDQNIQNLVIDQMHFDKLYIFTI
jgi:hypothetical protein